MDQRIKAMPLFEYKCDDCDTKFEELVTNSEQSVVCPDCKSAKVSKQLSVFSASAGSSGGSDLPCGQPSCGSGYS
jgi:putative FmdB family regulatory protein